MFRFLFRWMTRGALLAGMAALLHSCGAAHFYADDEIFAVTASRSEAGPQNGRQQ